MTTRIPGSYRLARFFLSGRLWECYLDWLMRREHRWNHPTQAESHAETVADLKKLGSEPPEPGKHKLDLLEPTFALIEPRKRNPNGRMAAAGKAAAVASVRAAINHARDLEAEETRRKSREFSERIRRIAAVLEAGEQRTQGQAMLMPREGCQVRRRPGNETAAFGSYVQELVASGLP